MATAVRRCIVCKSVVNESYYTLNGSILLRWQHRRRPPQDEEGRVCDDCLGMLGQLLHVSTEEP
jgi:hypothetical protein